MVAVTPELLLAPKQSISLGYVSLGLGILVYLQSILIYSKVVFSDSF